MVPVTFWEKKPLDVLNFGKTVVIAEQFRIFQLEN
jgi:hypothetical protein